MSILSRMIAKGSNKANVEAQSPTRYGTVSSVSGQTVNVIVDGNSEATPCTTTVRCRAGQRVMVEVRNGMAVVTGNVTSPSPDGATIDDVIEDVDGVRRLVRETTDGTLTAQVGQPFGSLVAADGGVYVVSLTWDDEEPTVVSAWNTIDEDGLAYVNMGVTGQPYFKTDGDNLEVGLGSGTRMVFKRSGFRSLLNGATKIFGIGNGSSSFQDKFSVGLDGGISTAAYDMPASTAIKSGANVFEPVQASSPSERSVTRTAASAAVWGKMCDIAVTFTTDKDVSVPAHGNIGNITIGTIVEGLRPAVVSNGQSHGDNAGQCWYYINTAGVVQLTACEGTGTARTIDAGTTFHLHAHYLLP